MSLNFMSINLGDAVLHANYLIKDGDNFIPESWLWGILSLDTLKTAVTDTCGLVTGLYARGLIDRLHYQRAHLTTLSQLE